SMAKRVQQLCQYLVDNYDGDAAALWRDVATGKELLDRLNALPGFGKQKSQIFLALLGKQYGVRPVGWREAAGAYGEEGSYRSVADITGPESLDKVRAFKQEAKRAAKAAAPKRTKS
ncbi:HhH-GPD-type base excision DNA repair protein, partial [Streptomyces sp. MCAF7]